ncbi:MAG TPA: outer membrane protein assembly factor BamC [Usitatibacteraceae bacterium]
MLTFKSVTTAVVAGLLLAGCSAFGPNKNADYRSQGNKIPSLEIPPDLTSPLVDDRYTVPDGKATTFSAYNRERGAAPASGTTAVLPKIDSAYIVRAGDQRWLVVKATPEKLWPMVKDFWKETGFTIKRETPEVGIIDTDWAENRSKIPDDFIRSTIGRVFDGLYSSGERDRFRTRLEAGAEPGTTEIYVSHRGVEEVYTGTDKLSTAWQNRPADHELEAEMMARMMVKFGYAPDQKAAIAGTTAAPASATPPRASYDKDKGGSLQIAEAFDRAWRRIGLALDRTGFTVEDRDRSKGLFFVRYIDPDAEVQSSGFLDKLAFWRKDEPPKPQYRIYVAEAAGVTNVDVQTADGKTDNSSTAKRILSLLLEQLK